MKTPPQHGFGDIPKKYMNYDTASIVISPVPYDDTSTWIKGARNGPAKIIEASGHMELYDIETDSEVYRKGIYTDNFMDGYVSPEDMVKDIFSRTSAHLSENKFVVCLGGEHSISIGAVKAHSETFNNLSVLQLDAKIEIEEHSHMDIILVNGEPKCHIVHPLWSLQHPEVQKQLKHSGLAATEESLLRVFDIMRRPGWCLAARLMC